MTFLSISCVCPVKILPHRCGSPQGLGVLQCIIIAFDSVGRDGLVCQKAPCLEGNAEDSARSVTQYGNSCSIFEASALVLINGCKIKNLN